MTGAVSAYDGPGFTEVGAPKPVRRDGVKRSHRKLVGAFVDIGNQALNAADYEATMHLPVGRGRKACDPETGEFDPDANRPAYNPVMHPQFPVALHSTITEGEHEVAHSQSEVDDALASKKWSLVPLEKKKRFVLTADDQMKNLELQIQAERAARFQREKEDTAGITGAGAAGTEKATMLEIQLREEKEKREALEAKFEALMNKLNAPAVDELGMTAKERVEAAKKKS